VIRAAIDVSPLVQTRAGTARYLKGLLRELRRRDDVELQTRSFGRNDKLSTLARDSVWYPLVLGRERDADVLHCPTYRGPLRPKAPLVVTVHDLAVFRHPGTFNRWTRTYSPRLVPRVLAAARRVIAVSEFTKRELVELLAVPENRISVVPNAVEDVFTPEGPKAPGDYVLAVGTLEPRKNLERIARAVDGELRVVGARGWGGVEAPANVTWLPNTSDEELAALYRGARCLVYASLYEGFGIPVAEALACGCPIVTSAGSPMADLAGGDAVLVDPADVAAISDAIGRATSPVARRVASWEDVAARTLAVYEEAVA
jgi:glycosyltransferase involved in cell wall biosynthesis